MTPPPPPLPPVNLSSRAKFLLSGPDAARYLNGQITNDLRKLAPGASMPACLLDAKGRMQALVQIRADGAGGFLLDAPGVLREDLAARLDRYIIADDVQAADVTDEFALFFAEGAEPGSLAAAGGCAALQSSRFGAPGLDLWAPAAGKDTLLSALGPAVEESDPFFEAVRIARGRPAWGAELSPASLPGEAGLDLWAVDFAKGCYIGQEVVSRMKSVGHPAKVLRRFRLIEGPAPVPGWELFGPEGNSAGSVTSATDGVIPGLRAALGYVKWAARENRLFAAAPPGADSPQTRLELWD